MSIDLTRFVANERYAKWNGPSATLCDQLNLRNASSSTGWQYESDELFRREFLYRNANVFCHAFVAEKTRKIGISLFYRMLKRLYSLCSFLFSLSFSFFLSFNSFLLIIQAKICLFFPLFFLNFFERDARDGTH